MKPKAPQASRPERPRAPASTSSVVYLHGVAIPGDPTVLQGLQCLDGIGRSKAKAICRTLGLREEVPRSRRSRDEWQWIEHFIADQVVVEADRRRRDHDAVARHRLLGTHRGIRMRQGLPVRGQRTKSNAKTAKRRNRSRGA